MLTREQEKLIRSLAAKKGRDLSGLCLVEGKKAIETAGEAVVLTFESADTKHFSKLVTTQTPQGMAALAKIPQWNVSDVTAKNVIVVLDGVQDPGNVGSILRLCLGYDAGLILIESADVTSSKVIRSSAGTLFQVPWMRVGREHALEALKAFNRPMYRLEKVSGAHEFDAKKIKQPCCIVLGSEGTGIQLPFEGQSLAISHNEKLESLNVGHALAIVLFSIHQV